MVFFHWSLLCSVFRLCALLWLCRSVSSSFVSCWFMSDVDGRFVQCEVSFWAELFRVACIYAPNGNPARDNLFLMLGCVFLPLFLILLPLALVFGS